MKRTSLKQIIVYGALTICFAFGLGYVVFLLTNNPVLAGWLCIAILSYGGICTGVMVVRLLNILRYQIDHYQIDQRRGN